MVNLFLDDLRQPPNDGAEWTVCRTAEEAQSLLLAGFVNVASLDHDLGECARCSALRGYNEPSRTCTHRMSGYDLVKWMAEHDIWPMQKPTVHSMNPVGAANMRATIDRYWRAP